MSRVFSGTKLKQARVCNHGQADICYELRSACDKAAAHRLWGLRMFWDVGEAWHGTCGAPACDRRPAVENREQRIWRRALVVMYCILVVVARGDHAGKQMVRRHHKESQHSAVAPKGAAGAYGQPSCCAADANSK